jgi:hypothetical protein
MGIFLVHQFQRRHAADDRRAMRIADAAISMNDGVRQSLDPSRQLLARVCGK